MFIALWTNLRKKILDRKTKISDTLNCFCQKLLLSKKSHSYFVLLTYDTYNLTTVWNTCKRKGVNSSLFQHLCLFFCLTIQHPSSVCQISGFHYIISSNYLICAVPQLGLPCKVFNDTKARIILQLWESIERWSVTDFVCCFVVLFLYF